jgi:hypothetical protein
MSSGAPHLTAAARLVNLLKNSNKVSPLTFRGGAPSQRAAGARQSPGSEVLAGASPTNAHFEIICL